MVSGRRPGRADVNCTVRSESDEPCRHLTTTRVVDADEEDLRLFLDDEPVGLSQRPQSLTCEPVGEDRDEDIYLGAAEQIDGLRDESRDRLLREDPLELPRQVPRGLGDVLLRGRVPASSQRSSHIHRLMSISIAVDMW
jgi:hypothetical protein